MLISLQYEIAYNCNTIHCIRRKLNVDSHDLEQFQILTSVKNEENKMICPCVLAFLNFWYRSFTFNSNKSPT